MSLQCSDLLLSNIILYVIYLFVHYLSHVNKNSMGQGLCCLSHNCDFST